MNFYKVKFNLPELVKQLIQKNIRHFLIIYLFSLLIIVLFNCKYDKIVILLTIVLFNLNALIHFKLWGNLEYQQEKADNQLEKQLHNQIANFEWLQKIINQIWPGDLVISFQKELNKFYTKNRNTEFKFYHFYLNENQPPKIDQMYIPLESMRKDEIVIHLRITIIGTVLFKLNEENEQDKNEATLANLLIKKYGFMKKYRISQYQDANLKKKNFLTKEFYLNGKSRIVLRPLTDCLPYFTSLNFTLLDYPILYSNDTHDLCESSNEFENHFYNYLIERICLPFLYPNRLIILYAHQNHIKREHGLLFKQKLSETNQFMQTKLRRLFKTRRTKVNDFIHELNDHQIINWYKKNIIENLDLIELNLNSSTFHPFPLFISRIKLIELENIMVSNCVLFIRIRIGQLSVNKLKLITSKSPVLNLTHLLPVHDYYEQCIIQIIQIKSDNSKVIKKCAIELESEFWNQKLNKLPTNDRLIRPIGELVFPIDRRAFDMNYSLNGQDFWLPLDGPKQGMIHLSCAFFKLSSAFRTIRKLSKITRVMMIKNSDLNSNLLPVAFIKIYVENFVCTYKKENKLKSRRNQFSQVQLSIYKNKKLINLMKMTKTRLIFRDSCHFFIYDDPFNFDLLVELLDKNKNDANFKLENEENKMRLINLINLEDYKKNKSKLYHNEKLSIYIVNNKDFIKTLDKKQKQNLNFKFIDKEEYGKLTLNLFIKYVNLDSHILEKLLLAPEIRGYNVENKKEIKKSAETIKKDETQLNDLVPIDKKKKFKNDECVGKLYFKLINNSCLEIGVINVINVPYDKTKRVKLQVIIELWKGNFKIETKKTPFTDIVHNPTFETAFQFNIDSFNLQQFAIRFVVIQKSGFFRSVLKIIAERFCTIPRLTNDICNLKIGTYILKTDKKATISGSR